MRILLPALEGRNKELITKIEKLIISLLIIVTMIISPLLSIEVQATEGGNGEGLNGGGSTQYIVNGPSANKQFWLVYITDEAGSIKSSVAIIKSGDMSYTGQYIYTRPEHGSVAPSIIKEGCEFGFSYDGYGHGRGTAIKNWMLQKDSAGMPQAYGVIADLWGEDMATQWVANQWYLCLENGMWCNVYKDGRNTGVSFAGTSYGWGLLQFNNNIGDKGDSKINRYTNNILPNSSRLQFTQTGVQKPVSSGKVTNSDMIQYGHGMLILWAGLLDGQTTCDEPQQPNPHPAPLESKGAVNIVKNYRLKTARGTYEEKGCYKTEKVSNQITIEEEEEYRVVGWKTSDSTVYPIDSINWNPPGNITQQGKTAGNTKLIYPKEKTLYVLLEKSEEPEEEEYDADYIVKESQISRKISLNTTDKGDDILLGKEFIWKFGDLKTCGGHYQKGSHDDDCEEGCTEDHGTTNYCKFDLVDKNWLFDIINEKEGDYPNNLAVALWPSEYNKSIPGERETVEEGEIAKDGFTYDVVIHRGNDNLGIADFVSENNKSLGELADFTVTNQKGHTRKEVDFQDSVELSFGDNSTDKITTSKGTLGCRDEDEAELSENYDVNVDILYKTYSGDQGEGKVNTDINSDDMIFSSGSKIISGHMVKSGLNFNYLPLVTMRYDDMETKDNLIEVLGEYYRGMDLNDYAEVIWEKQKHPNLSLSSLQWSTHAQPKADLDGLASDDDEGKCLPGGASFSIGIRKENREKIVARTYQCILIDEGREQVELTSGNSIDGFTEETALENHDAYVKSIEDGVNGMWIQQFQAKNMSENPLKQGIQVFNGYDISKLGVTKTASVEDKYYFSNSFDQTANSGCLDFKEGNTNTELYTFSSDRCGNILMNGSVILNKTQDASALSGKAKEINDRTLVVTKLVDSLERNTGDDAENTWTDSKWYNEQFRGITVAVSTTTIETGFIKPVERTSVLDPKLNTKSSGQADLFKTGYMSAALKTSNYSESYGEDEVIGVFKDQMIKMDQMEWFYYSKKFYISNITTQDLH